MKPVLSYGDFSFQPVEDEKVPRTICRDVPGEFRISQAITRYFKYRDESGETLLIRDDEEAMYRLLSEGMAEFMELGTVFVSEEAEKSGFFRRRGCRWGFRLWETGWSFMWRQRE